jgi:hypothetical protein
MNVYADVIEGALASVLPLARRSPAVKPEQHRLHSNKTGDTLCVACLHSIY